AGGWIARVPGRRSWTSAGVRLEQREKNDVPDARRVGEDHRQSIDADALTGGRRHAVLEGPDVVLVVVHRLRLTARLGLDLGLEALLLVQRIVELAEGVGDLAAAHVQLEAIRQLRVLI